jgi:hypothetical protein
MASIDFFEIIGLFPLARLNLITVPYRKGRCLRPAAIRNGVLRARGKPLFARDKIPHIVI